MTKIKISDLLKFIHIVSPYNKGIIIMVDDPHLRYNKTEWETTQCFVLVSSLYDTLEGYPYNMMPPSEIHTII